MQKTYGESLSELTVYHLINPLTGSEDSGTQIFSQKYTDSEENKLWAGASVTAYIPEKEQENYRVLWEKYQQGLNEENWEEFSKNSRMTSIILEQTDGILLITFNGYNLMIYEELKNQISVQ